MCDKLLNCWEIMGCKRDKESVNHSNLDECIVSEKSMGHSCWAVAGSMNASNPFCPQVKERGVKCSFCKVYGLYSRSLGTQSRDIKEFFPNEENYYRELILKRTNKNN